MKHNKYLILLSFIFTFNAFGTNISSIQSRAKELIKMIVEEAPAYKNEIRLKELEKFKKEIESRLNSFVGDEKKRQEDIKTLNSIDNEINKLKNKKINNFQESLPFYESITMQIYNTKAIQSIALGLKNKTKRILTQDEIEILKNLKKVPTGEEDNLLLIIDYIVRYPETLNFNTRHLEQILNNICEFPIESRYYKYRDNKVFNRPLGSDLYYKTIEKIYNKKPYVFYFYQNHHHLGESNFSQSSHAVMPSKKEFFSSISQKDKDILSRADTNFLKNMEEIDFSNEDLPDLQKAKSIIEKRSPNFTGSEELKHEYIDKLNNTINSLFPLKKETLKRKRIEIQEDDNEVIIKKSLKNSRQYRDNNIKRPYNLAKKYFEEKFLDEPKNLSKLQKKSQIDKSHNLQFVSLKEIMPSEIPIVARAIEHIKENDNYLKLLYKHDKYFKQNDDDFLVTVLLGRGLKAFVPKLEEGIKVLLVITDKQYQEDEPSYLYLIDRGYSVLVINSLSINNKKIEDEKLGLVTSRRVASLFFAQHKKAKNMLMLDDNLDKIYFSDKIENKSFYSILSSFKNEALKNDFSLISLRQLNYQLDRGILDKNSKIKESHYGAKIFYFDFENITKKLSHFNASDFLPPLVDIWGEDLYMQLYFLENNLKVGVFNRGFMLLKRNPQNKNICHKSLYKKAEAWINDGEINNIFLNMDHKSQKVYKVIQEIVNENLEKKRKEQINIYNLDLAQETAKKMNYTIEQFSGNIIHLIEKTDKIESNTYIDNVLNIMLPSIISETDEKRLLDHQINALGALRQNKIGYFSMAVASGKSMVINTIIASLMSTEMPQGKNIALLVPTMELVNQAYRTIIKFNDMMKNNGVAIDLNRVIAVSSRHNPQEHVKYNKIINEGGNLLIFCNNSFDNYFSNDTNNLIAVLVDELHRMEISILDKLAPKKNELLLYGFSATPTREKSNYFEKSIYSYSQNQGIKDKVIAPNKVFYMGERYDDDTFVPEQIESEEFTNFVDEKLLGMGGLIFVESVPRANKIALFLKNNFFTAEVITSARKPQEISDALEKFTNGDVQILIAVRKLQEGFDAPVDFIFIDKEVNEETEKQIIGRGQRKFGDDNKIVLIFKRRAI